jgi:hypothetical protein
MPRKRNVRTSTAAKKQDRTGEMAIAVLIDIMYGDGVVLDKNMPSRVSNVARRLGWDYKETAAFAKKMVGLVANRIFSTEEPELPKPEKKPDLKETLASLLNIAQAALSLLPDGVVKGKGIGKGISFSTMLKLAQLFAGGGEQGGKKQ